MESLGGLLVECAGELTTRWHEAVRTEALGTHGLSVDQLKDSLEKQLKIVGEAILGGAVERAAPWELWRDPSRLAPEDRVLQQVPIEELVAEYAQAVEVVRLYLAEKSLQVPFAEYAFFSSTMFYLAAEAARRYAVFAQERVTTERRLYVAGIAHQMRTPLAAIATQTQALQRSGVSERWLAIIHRNVRRLILLVEGVLRLERFKASELPVHAIRLNLLHLLEDIGTDHFADAERKGLRLEIRADPGLVAELDPDLLTDAIGNLLSNAVRNTERGFVRIDAGQFGDRLRIDGADSGSGIEADKRARLFDVGESAGRGSTGLGLAIAKRAVEAMGGSISVQPREGGGSVFSLDLPAHQTVRLEDTEAPSHAP